MTILYSDDDTEGSRWSGVGRLLTAQEVNYNFYQHETRLTAVEAAITVTVSIDTITQPSPTTLLFTMTDSSTQGPFTLPTSTFQDRGTWLPSTPYLVNDTFTSNGSLYRVIFDHTSGLTFSPTANDGAGHDYYAAMMSSPGNALPTGGATGMILKKSSGTDYAVIWGYALPNGGTTNKVLAKLSNTDQDFGWITVPASAVSFSPSTASGLTSTDVQAALEEIEANIQTLSIATAAEYQNNTSGKVLTTDKVWSAADIVTLTDAATIAVDMSTFINAAVTLAGNRSLGNASNTKNGQSGFIKIVQDATGSRTLSYGSNWKFAGGTAPTLTTTANAVDLLFYEVISSTLLYATLIKDVK